MMVIVPAVNDHGLTQMDASLLADAPNFLALLPDPLLHFRRILCAGAARCRNPVELLLPLECHQSLHKGQVQQSARQVQLGAWTQTVLLDGLLKARLGTLVAPLAPRN